MERDTNLERDSNVSVMSQVTNTCPSVHSGYGNTIISNSACRVLIITTLARSTDFHFDLENSVTIGIALSSDNFSFHIMKSFDG